MMDWWWDDQHREKVSSDEAFIFLFGETILMICFWIVDKLSFSFFFQGDEELPPIAHPTWMKTHINTQIMQKQQFTTITWTNLPQSPQSLEPIKQNINICICSFHILIQQSSQTCCITMIHYTITIFQGLYKTHSIHWRNSFVHAYPVQPTKIENTICNEKPS